MGRMGRMGRNVNWEDVNRRFVGAQKAEAALRGEKI